MTENLLVAGDVSGIQRYVLNVSAVGRGQARRLRARSFFVELVSGIAIWKLLQVFGADLDCVITSGGGQFLLRVPSAPGCKETLQRIRDELEERLFSDVSGELGLSLALGTTVEEALRQKERKATSMGTELDY